MYCKSCGTALEEGYMVCPECGTKTGEGSGHCPSCGKEVIPGNGFCANCGAAFADNGVKTIPVQTAAPAPKASGSDFNIGNYFKEFGNNFTGIFKKPDFIFDYGTCFTSVLVLLISLLPSYGYIFPLTGNFFTYSTFDYSWLAAILIVFAFFFSVRRFFPHVYNFIETDPTLSKLVLFVVPGLHVLAHLVIFFKSIIGIFAKGYLVFPFIFGGFFILITIAEIVVTIVAFIKRNKK